MYAPGVERRRHRTAAAVALLGCALTAWWPTAGSDCTRTSVGFIPLDDLGTGTYQGVEGGLYPGGGNLRPPSHDANADSFARVALLDAAGAPNAATGTIVILTVGMST